MKTPKFNALTRFVLIFALMTIAAPLSVRADLDRRPLSLELEGEWIGAGVSYGEYRDGQSPDGQAPTIEQVREDLHIIARHWNLIRMYGTRNLEKVCQVIREDKLPIRVMAGAWIGSENDQTGIESNRSEIEKVIEITNEYPDVVIAINVGNETQVYWSGHRIARETLIGYIREVRERTIVPVTTCDDYNFWNKPEAVPVEAEIDFIGYHTYAMWNGKSLGESLDWTRQQLRDVQERFPDSIIVHTETGWATQKHSEGEQGKLILGVAGEAEQELFYRAYTHWATQNRVPHFYFQAFDEQWKGGPHPDEVEKHWGLYNSDRTPKRVFSNTGLVD